MEGQVECYIKDNAELVRVGWSDQAGAGARREEANTKSSLPCLMCMGLQTSFKR